MSRNTQIYFHTGAPAPYRKHQFELLAREFHRITFCFSGKVASYRPWSNSTADWKADIRYVNQWQLIKMLIFQRWGSVHVGGDVKCKFFWPMLMISGLIGHSRVIKWSDGSTASRMRALREEKGNLSFKTKIINWMLLHGTVGVFTPGSFGRSWARLMGYRDDQIINAYFSHDVDSFYDFYVKNHIRENEIVRRKLGVDESKVVLLNISRYLDWKRLEDLAESLLIIENLNPILARDCELVLIGDGDWREHLSILNRLKIVKVHLIKNMPANEVLSYYCAANLFVFPSEGDVWGLVVNEALSMGVPVICTDEIGSSELVKNGVNGYQVPVRSPNRIAEHILELLANRELLMRMSENALSIRETWKTAFGIEQLKDFLIRRGYAKA